MATSQDNTAPFDAGASGSGVSADQDGGVPASEGRQRNRLASGRIVTTLAELPDRALLDERALAEALRVSMRTVRRMVGRFELPPPVRFAGRSTWQVRTVLAWFEARAARLARQADRNARRLEDASRATIEISTSVSKE